MILHLSHKEIDKSLWDSCLQNSSNGVVYASSWYLDQVSPGWEALVLDEYKAIMPLPVKRKWGICYLIRPPFCQQLGIFSKYAIDEALVKEFISKIPARFRWMNVPLNEANPYAGSASGINYILPLLPRYEMLCSAYVQNTKRNLRKSVDVKSVPEYSEDINSLVSLKVQHEFTSVTSKNKKFLIALYEHYRRNIEAEIICVRDDTKSFIAGALFIHFGNRWIYLLSSSSSKGKEERAMFAIIDKFIHDHSSSMEFLDFEGSSIPELARFFAGFGAVPVNYPVLKINRLPFPLNLIKK